MSGRQVPAWTLAIASGGAVICGVGWFTDQRPTATVWGSVGEVTGGIGATAALAFAGYEIAVSRARRRADQQEARLAAARSVGIASTLAPVAPPSGWEAVVEVHNATAYPIDSVVIVIPDRGYSDADPGEQIRSAVECVIGTLLPGRTHQETLSVILNSGWDPSFGELTEAVYVIFVDVWGQSWLRGSGSIEPLAHPPRLC